MGEQGGEADHLDVGQVLGDFTGQFNALFEGKQRVLLRTGSHGNDDGVEQPRGALDEITMPLGDGVKGAWVQHSIHRDVLKQADWDADGSAAGANGQAVGWWRVSG